jgi:hypothetical protein
MCVYCHMCDVDHLCIYLKDVKLSWYIVNLDVCYSLGPQKNESLGYVQVKLVTLTEFILF